MRMNWNAFEMLLHVSSTHCGPSGTPTGGAGNPKSEARTSLPSSFLPVAIMRGPSGTLGPYPNGRIFKLVLDKHDPLEVESLSILPNANFDLGGYNNVNVAHQPDNVETTKHALLITEDPGGHNQGATTARVWRYNLDTEAAPDVVLRVDQSSDPTTPKAALGNWESSGIVDASDAFGRDMFLIDVQAHGWEIETATNPTRSRENGQLLLVKIPGT